MSAQPQNRTLFVGIGSPHGDDRIGWLVAETLRSRVPSEVDVRQAATPSGLLDWLDGVDRLIVCDACVSCPNAILGELPLHRWQWPTSEVAVLRSAGSHAIGLPLVLKLAEQLGTLPREVIVFGVEGSCFDAFAELSAELATACHRIVQTIADACRGCSNREAAHHA